MADILSIPAPTKEKGQRSLSVEDAYFARFVPSWTFPSGLSPAQWRFWVRTQPVAIDFRDTLIASIQSLDWKITPRDSDMRDELRNATRYHTRLLERGGNWLDLDWTGMLEWLLSDLMDLPFGCAVEVGRRGDSPGGRVEWFKPLDGGTLYPTLNKDRPVMQYYASAIQVISFPKHAINRMYLAPRPELEREGWGMAPPEKVYLAMEMLSRGDQYYANLLLDIPPAGILDLGDMQKDSALEWVNSFRTFIAGGGADGFKIPVLYEHTTKPEFIPFGKVPNDIMYDRITLKYAALVGAAYGMSLNDIGLQGTSGSGETLAGSIRSERRTRKTGLARLKKKLKFFFENMLPDNLQFDWIDLDDELATAKGRARLANATAFGQWIQQGVFDRKEARLQAIQDGLIDISLPEEPPSKPDPAWAVGKPQERPGMLGSPQAPSQGGDGEVKVTKMKVKKGRAFSARINKLVKRIVEDILPILTVSRSSVNEDELYLLKSAIDESLYGEEDVFGIGEILKSIWVQDNWISVNDEGLEEELREVLSEFVEELPDMKSVVEDLKTRVFSEFKVFIGKSVVSMLKDYVLREEFDYSASDSYIVDTIRKNVVDNFNEFASACVGLEVEKLTRSYCG